MSTIKSNCVTVPKEKFILSGNTVGITRRIRNKPGIRNNNVIPHYGDFYDRKRRYYENINLYKEINTPDPYFSPKIRASIFTLLEIIKDVISVIVFPIALLRLGYRLEGKAYDNIACLFKTLGLLFIPLVGIYLAGRYLRERDSKVLSMLGFLLQLSNVVAAMALIAGLLAIAGSSLFMFIVLPLEIFALGVWLMRNESIGLKVLGGINLVAGIGAGIFLGVINIFHKLAPFNHAFLTGFNHAMGSFAHLTSNLLSSTGHLFTHLLSTAPQFMTHALQFFQNHLLPFLATTAATYAAIGVAGLVALRELYKTAQAIYTMWETPNEHLSTSTKVALSAGFGLGTVGIAVAAVAVIMTASFPPFAVIAITLAAAALFLRAMRKIVTTTIKKSIDNTAKKEGYKENPYILRKCIPSNDDDKQQTMADKWGKDDTMEYCNRKTAGRLKKGYYCISDNRTGPYVFAKHIRDDMKDMGLAEDTYRPGGHYHLLVV